MEIMKNVGGSRGRPKCTFEVVLIMCVFFAYDVSAM